jgi:hypothetical protein
MNIYFCHFIIKKKELKKKNLKLSEIHYPNFKFNGLSHKAKFIPIG